MSLSLFCRGCVVEFDSFSIKQATSFDAGGKFCSSKCMEKYLNDTGIPIVMKQSPNPNDPLKELYLNGESTGDEQSREGDGGGEQ